METGTYFERRGEIATYFDRTAAQAWARMTSDAPLGHIRASVREGRTRMRELLLSWLPSDLRGLRLLDAGCGTGALSVEAARRGADVVAIDLSPTLVRLACERLPADLGPGRVQFCAGDMLDPALGRFDHVVAMDSLIHYEALHGARVLSQWAQRTAGSMLFTIAPRTPALAAMHAVGRWFPRGSRAPAIVPVAPAAWRQRLLAEPELAAWYGGREQRVSCGFYTSQAIEWRRA